MVLWQLEVLNQKIPNLKEISNKLEYFKVKINEDKIHRVLFCFVFLNR